MSLEGLGQRLKLAREEKGLSQAQLANLVGAAQTTIAKIERGETKLPRRDLIMEIADKLGVSAAHLLFGLEELELLDKEGIEFALAYAQLSEKTRK